MDRPIIFSAPMVRALMEGRKTQTRRLAWREPRDEFVEYVSQVGGGVPGTIAKRPSPWQRVMPGDRLWVRENFRIVSVGPDLTTGVVYLGTDPDTVVFITAPHGAQRNCGRNTPSIHMPRWVSRLTLVVTTTKVERLQNITPADAIAEGCGVSIGHPTPAKTREPFPCEAFKDLWIRLHGADAWADNPEVVAMTFAVHHVNIDQMERIAA